MRKLAAFLFSVLSFTLVAPFASLAADEAYGPQKVVYHFNTNNPQTNMGGLKNIQNHLNALPKGQLKAEAVINSMGWEMVVKAKADPRQLELIRVLQERGVVFKICRNTLNEHKIDVADLAVPMVIVPAGVAEITKLQMSGYAYIKP